MKRIIPILSLFCIVSNAYGHFPPERPKWVLLWHGKSAQVVSENLDKNDTVQCHDKTLGVYSKKYMECQLIFDQRWDVSFSKSEIIIEDDAAAPLYRNLTLPEYDPTDPANPAYRFPYYRKADDPNPQDATVSAMFKPRRCARGCCSNEYRVVLKLENTSMRPAIFPVIIND